MNMISTMSWVPKGACKPVPVEADPPSVEEIEEMIVSGALQHSDGGDEEQFDGELDDVADMVAEDSKDVESDVTQALSVAAALGKTPKREAKFKDIADAMDDLDMEHYDDDDEDEVDLFSSGLGDLYYPSNEMDPNLNQNDDNDDDSEDQDALTIKPTDGVIVCAGTVDYLNHLEVWIVEETETGEPNTYVHHEVLLSKIPLCTAWLDCPLKGGDKGNYIAVGTMGAEIEIFNLDVLHEVEPTLVLGGKIEKRKRKSEKKSVKYKKDSHTDAVLGLAWNKEYRNVLASASADKLVKIWDMSTETCVTTMNHHTDKVQAAVWNPHDAQMILTGSFDHTVVMRDCKKLSECGSKWSIPADIESVAWDPHDSHSFVVSLKNGTVQGFDSRFASETASTSQPTFTLHAHDGAVCSVSYNPSAPKLLATGSSDKTVKLWDLSNNQPSCLASRNPKAGKVFSLSFSVDIPHLLAIGGSKATLQVWNILNEAGIARKFGSFLQPSRP